SEAVGRVVRPRHFDRLAGRRACRVAGPEQPMRMRRERAAVHIRTSADRQGMRRTELRREREMFDSLFGTAQAERGSGEREMRRTAEVGPRCDDREGTFCGAMRVGGEALDELRAPEPDQRGDQRVALTEGFGQGYRALEGGAKVRRRVAVPS